MCLNPKWIEKNGNYKEDNYRGKAGDYYSLGTFSKCGHCEQCINEKANNWVVRNYYEEKSHKDKCFITLTYKENPYMIVKKDLQDFMKRFRIRLDRTTGEKIRMFGAMEYGELNHRPHAHVIIYGWQDDHAKYLGVNKKRNIIYQSELIESTWGLGRTSIQGFNEHEAPYITMYNTAKETFKGQYIVNQEKLRDLERRAKKADLMPQNQRVNLFNQISEIENEMRKSKQKYLSIREFNTWSQGLGWENFYDEYAKAQNYNFIEYIEEKQFTTPSPWVKRLANMGDIRAAQEMFKREREIIQSKNADEERRKNEMMIYDRRKREIIEWRDQKDELEWI